MMFLAPSSTNKRETAFPAAPTPLKTIFTSDRFFFTNFNELRRAASTTIAVPC